MDQRKPARPSQKVVKALETPRLTAATAGVAAKMGEVLNNAGGAWNPRLLSSLYATAALEADDAYAEQHDLICQHYSIRKSDLAEVVDLATAALAGQHSLTPKHGEDSDCPGCLRSLGLGRIRSALQWTSAPGWDRS